MKTAVKNPYSVKGVKSFQGMEGLGFECSLYKDGKRIGTVTDVCDGGGYLQCNLKEGEEEALEAYCKTLPSETSEEYDITIDIDPCIFMSRLVDEFETNKTYKRWCKAKTVFRIDGDDEGSFRTINHVFDDKVKALLEQKYPNQGLYIVNEHLE